MNGTEYEYICSWLYKRAGEKDVYPCFHLITRGGGKREYSQNKVPVTLSAKLDTEGARQAEWNSTLLRSVWDSTEIDHGNRKF
jgi:hypothetical protein